MTAELKKRLAELGFSRRTLWAPGPHQLTPGVTGALQTYTATYSHRSSEFKAAYRRVQELLRDLFHIPESFTPLVFGHTGSYNWEMVAVNTPDSFRTLGMDIGAFSKKWAGVLRSHGRSVDTVKAEWGHGISPDTWRKALGQGYDLALLTHNETATGVALPVADLCAATREVHPETLVAVDGVSIAGAVEIDLGTFRPDYYLWSLQKDFSIPAIGSVMVVSDRAIETARSVPNRGYVLDLIGWADRASNAQTPMTVPDLTLRCLIARMEEMVAEGDARFERHRTLTRMQREWAQKHGLRLLAQPGFESPTVTAICLPDGIAGPAFVEAARTHLNVQITAGYGPLRDTGFRIAAMGQTTQEDMARVLRGLSLLLENWDQVQAG